MFIQNHKPITSCKRSTKSLYLYKFKKLFKLFKIFFKNNSGRNNQGNVTIFSKGKKHKLSTISLIKFSGWDKNLKVISGIFRNKKKLYTLNRHISGSFSVKPAISGTSIGQCIQFSSLPEKF